MQELRKYVFENTSVEIVFINEQAMFEVYSTGMALGQVKKNAVGDIFPRKDRIDKNIENADIEPCVHNGHKYLSESQLYDLMLEMKTDKVKPFRKWVTSEVLPQIRQTGGYIVNNREDEFIENYFPSFTDDTKLTMVLDLKTQNAKYKEQIATQNQQLTEQQPLVEYATQIVKSKDSIDMNDFAKIISKNGIMIGRIEERHAICHVKRVQYSGELKIK